MDGRILFHFFLSDLFLYDMWVEVNFLEFYKPECDLVWEGICKYKFLSGYGWHHQLNGHGFEWTLGVGDGQGGLVCCSSWGRKELDTTEWLSWTDEGQSSIPTHTEYIFSVRYRLLGMFVVWKLQTKSCYYFIIAFFKDLISVYFSVVDKAIITLSSWLSIR